MNQHVKKWGNSLAVRIPATLSAALNLKEDDAVEMREEDGRLVIEKAKRDHPTLDELLARVTPENIHPETDWGPPVGREFW
jgi:antitoxin MazE